MAQPEPGDVTRLVQEWNRGDRKALADSAQPVYRELRAITGFEPNLSR
jgi:hypothetical protein